MPKYAALAANGTCRLPIARTDTLAEWRDAIKLSIPKTPGEVIQVPWAPQTDQLTGGPARFRVVAAGLSVAVIPSLLLPTLPRRVRALRVEDPRSFRGEVLAVTSRERTPST